MDHRKAIELRKAGYTYQEIGDVFGVSRQRIEQVLKKHGASGRFPKIEIIRPSPEQRLQKKIDRFWSKVDIRGENECWNWKGKKYPTGYGVCKLHGISGSHRFAWFIVNGEIPSGMMICHTCDNPACCNPNHLFIGTAKDNVTDRENKKRGRRATASKEYYIIRNEEIFKMFESGMTQIEISEKLKLSYVRVNQILHYYKKIVSKPEGGATCKLARS